jgi:2-hydroxychromene-2-carboxylate isomerase
MTTPIDFYFDFSSPYGYFAAERIDALAAKYERAVNWHPVLLGVVFKSTGAVPLPMVPIKGPYAIHDFERTARFHGIAYRRPEVFPISTQAPARAMLWVAATKGDAIAHDFARAVYRAYFAEGVNISDAEQVVRIAAGFGLDGAELTEAINSPDVKDHLKTVIDLAMARGVFGSPFIIVDREPFWGFDRFDQIEAMLKNGTI